jgi:GLPGLI family protein
MPITIMKKFILHILVLLTALPSIGQDFLTKGSIEFEVKINTEKKFAEMFKDRQDRMMMMDNQGAPQFHVVKKQLLFDGDKILYRSLGNDPFAGGEGNAIFTDLGKGHAMFRGGMLMNNKVFEDSVTYVRWKIDDETRTIAGFKCRKAIGVIMDSVYVVAFYCPEIVPQGGPEIFNGLPGMILGLAIPRLYTTWFATKVQLEVDDKLLVAPLPPKKEKVMPMAEAITWYRNETKGFMREDVKDEEVEMAMKGIGGNNIYRRR